MIQRTQDIRGLLVGSVPSLWGSALVSDVPLHFSRVVRLTRPCLRNLLWEENMAVNKNSIGAALLPQKLLAPTTPIGRCPPRREEFCQRWYFAKNPLKLTAGLGLPDMQGLLKLSTKVCALFCLFTVDKSPCLWSGMFSGHHAFNPVHLPENMPHQT